MPKIVIMNAAVGGWYPAGQDRLKKSLEAVGWRHSTIFWRDQLPPGCPPHSRVPYAFKPYAFKAAMADGADVAIWLDSSMWAQASLDPILAHIAAHGSAVWLAGFSIGQWTHDRALARLGITRDVAMGIPLVCGGICGFDLHNQRARTLLRSWLAFAQDGISFQGNHSNLDAHAGSCSKDERCRGHRHDMPSLSYLVQQLEIEPIHPPKWFAYSIDECPAHPEAILLARGM